MSHFHGLFQLEPLAKMTNERDYLFTDINIGIQDSQKITGEWYQQENRQNSTNSH